MRQTDVMCLLIRCTQEDTHPGLCGVSAGDAALESNLESKC